LSDHSRRNWHPVEARDLLKGAGKLGVTEADLVELLVRCGFFAPQNLETVACGSKSARSAGPINNQAGRAM